MPFARELASGAFDGRSSVPIFFYASPGTTEREVRSSLVRHNATMISVKGDPLRGSAVVDLSSLRAMSKSSTFQVISNNSPRSITPTAVRYALGTSLPPGLGVVPSNVVATQSYLHFFPSPFIEGPDTLHAEDIKVGTVELAFDSEDSSKGCRIWEDHEAFKFVDFDYQRPDPIPCQGAQGDQFCRDKCGLTGACRRISALSQDVCVDAHATQVLSRIASNVNVGEVSRPHHAAKIDFYGAQVVNVGAAISVTPMELDTGYRYFEMNGVKFINESFAFDSRGETDPRDVLADWYARYHGLVFVKAAGNPNDDGFGGDLPREGHADCTSYNDICVGWAEWSESPLVSENWRTDQSTRYRNPYSFLFTNGTGEAREQEKPDLVQEACPVHGATLEDTTQWHRAQDFVDGLCGSSFSTPAVTGVAALLEELCMKKTGSGRSALWYRSLFRTPGTWESKHYDIDSCEDAGSDSPRYPAPHLDDHVDGVDCDYIAGAGTLTAKYLDNDRSCEPAGVVDGGSGGPATAVLEGVATPAEVLLDDDSSVQWQDLPGGDPTEEEQRQNTTKSRVASKMLRAGSDWLAARIYRLEDVPIGARVRSTFSYSACAQIAAHQPPALSVPVFPADPDWFEPAVNFDYGVRGKRFGASDEEWLFVAEAFDETNEGFDITTTGEAAFEYLDFYLLRPPASEWSACLTASGQQGTKSEPWVAWFAWSW
jgi:hypothetical protein